MYNQNNFGLRFNQKKKTFNNQMTKKINTKKRIFQILIPTIFKVLTQNENINVFDLVCSKN